MGWRTVVINKNCKLSYKNDYLIIRSEDLKMIHLSEINEMMPYYGSYNTSKKVIHQVNWSQERKDVVWQKIIIYKIHNQAMLLKNLNIDGYEKLLEYEKQVEVADKTNREGHAAKVYFNLLYGMEFYRSEPDNTNISLDYGYTILLSLMNREIVSKGYITQIGINHKNEFNQFNLSCDLMEIFRPMVDEIVYKNREFVFDKEYKHKLIDVCNREVYIQNKKQYLSNAIQIFINSVFDFLENNKESEILNYEF